MKSLVELFTKQINEFSAKTFIESDQDVEISYIEFYENVCRVANHLLQQGLNRGDRIVISLRNGIGFYVSYFATLVVGGIAVPISNKLKKHKLMYILNDCMPRFVFFDQNFNSQLNITADVGNTPMYGEININSETVNVTNLVTLEIILLTKDIHSNIEANSKSLEPAMIIYTSGSTGTPKGILSSHSNILFSAGAIAQYLELRSSDTILNFLPPSFDYGLYQAILTLYTGAKLSLIETFSYVEQLVNAISTRSISILPLVPSVAAGLLKFVQSSPDQVFDSMGKKKIRTITSTGDSFHPSYIRQLSEIFSTAKIFPMYGLTECKRVSYLKPELALMKPYCVGEPMPGVNVRIVDEHLNEVPTGQEGRLFVEGDNVTLGYWNDPELTNKHFLTLENGNRALLTNDIFTRDAEGYLYFKHRLDDVIKSGGHRISIKEITKLIQQIENVNEVLVLPYADKAYGTLMKALVVPYRSDPNFKEYLKKRLLGMVENSCMVPAIIEVVDNIPKSHHLKLSKTSIEETQYHEG